MLITPPLSSLLIPNIIQIETVILNVRINRTKKYILAVISREYQSR